MVLTCIHNLCFEQKQEKYQVIFSNFYHLKIVVFTAVKNCSIIFDQKMIVFTAVKNCSTCILQVRFNKNIPLHRRIINFTICLHCIGYCRMVIKLSVMKLLQFVNMYMCDKVVVGLFSSWGSWPNRGCV